ncbi:MAG TPA: enoyl-CoA hydratase-related protein, partial [Caulobacteraceae bacterium]|nr:enoyl-CoA hydratase-related protein [Caulobacteraceae bacterium]
MSNPIATPLVEDVDQGELDGLISLNTHADGAVLITLNQPLLSGATATALTEAFETLHGADHVRIVFIRGRNGTLCAGIDRTRLKVAAADWSQADLREEGEEIAGMLRALTAVPALTVTLVEGEAVGVGVALAAASDLAVAARDARFVLGEVTHGFAGWLAAPFVVNAIGPRQAKALFATGRAFDAAYAEKIGLVQEIVEDGAGLDAAVERLTEQAMAAAPAAVAESKHMVWDVWAKVQDHGLIHEVARRFAHSRFSEEGREGLTAALEGRRPNWT